VSLRRCAAAVTAATLIAACSGPARLQQAPDLQGLPAGIELSDTPFHPQVDFQCGPAALSALLGAAGVQVAPEELVREIYVPALQGSLQPEILGALRARHFVPYVIAPDIGALLAELAAGRPVLVLQRQGLGPWPAWHYAVAVGYDVANATITLRSGMEPRQMLSLRRFSLTWDRAERWAVIALPPGELPARPDFARYMAAAASIEAVGVDSGTARKAYLAASSQWPEEALPWLGLGNLAAAAGDWRSAEHGYRQAVIRAPQDAAAQNNLAEALRRLGCPRAARNVIDAAQLSAVSTDAVHRSLRDTAREIDADLAASTESGRDAPACAEASARVEVQ